MHERGKVHKHKVSTKGPMCRYNKYLQYTSKWHVSQVDGICEKWQFESIGVEVDNSR